MTTRDAIIAHALMFPVAAVLLLIGCAVLWVVT